MAYRELELTLLSARDLKNVNLISRMEVYAVVTISGDPLTRQCTAADPYGGRHPSWNATLRFAVPPTPEAAARGCLHVLLRAERVLGDRDVGEVVVPLAELLAGAATAGAQPPPPRLASYQVRKVHRGEPRGVLSVSYRLGPVVAPLEPTDKPPATVGFVYPVQPPPPTFQPQPGAYAPPRPRAGVRGAEHDAAPATNGKGNGPSPVRPTHVVGPTNIQINVSPGKADDQRPKEPVQRGTYGGGHVDAIDQRLVSAYRQPVISPAATSGRPSSPYASLAAPATSRYHPSTGIPRLGPPHSPLSAPRLPASPRKLPPMTIGSNTAAVSPRQPYTGGSMGDGSGGKSSQQHDTRRGAFDTDVSDHRSVAISRQSVSGSSGSSGSSSSSFGSSASSPPGYASTTNSRPRPGGASPKAAPHITKAASTSGSWGQPYHVATPAI
ncbi:hypothetical protein ACP4OV_010390 [Aristida adscensionis]